jgi:hypothetical protein
LFHYPTLLFFGEASVQQERETESSIEPGRCSIWDLEELMRMMDGRRFLENPIMECDPDHVREYSK